MAAKSKKPFLSVDLDKNAGKFVATSWDEAAEWVDAEIAQWEWLYDASQQFNMREHLHTSYNQQLNQIKDSISRARSEENTETARQDVERRVGHYSKELIPSSSPEGKFIIGLKDETPRVASAALAMMLNVLQPNQPDKIKFAAIRGQVEAILFRAGVSEKTQTAVSDSLETIAAEYGTRLEQDRAKFVQLHDELETAKQAAHEAIQTGKAEANKRWGEYQRKSRKDVSDAVESLEATEKAYKEHMQLAASVDYWKKKSKEHSKKAGDFRRWLVRYAVGGGIAIMSLLFALSQYGVHLASITPVADGQAATPSAVYFILATMGLVGTTIVFWIGRVLVRLFMSEHHLGIDSEERATMIQTYLALIADGAATDEERPLILEALFRPTSDGIVKEDISPDTSIAGLAARLVDKR